MPKCPKRLLLLGAGHAHLETIAASRLFTSRGFELVVVAPGEFWYSGGAAAVLSGARRLEDNVIDVATLTERGGGRFLPGWVETIDPIERSVLVRGGTSIGYDVLSINLGSEVPTWTIPGLATWSLPVKPMSNLLLIRDCLRAASNAQLQRPLRLVVLGGGATACEIAGNLLGLVNRESARAQITVVTSGPRLLESWPRRAGRIAANSLQQRGGSICLGARVTSVEDGGLSVEGGQRIPFDRLIAAIGLVPNRVIRSAGLPLDHRGALVVDEHLRSVAAPQVFGGGDCVSVQGWEVPAVGVHGVRQAPILRHNLLAALEGSSERGLASFRPQTNFLQILNLGDGTGLASWGSYTCHSPLALFWKDWIDRRFLERYRLPSDC